MLRLPSVFLTVRVLNMAPHKRVWCRYTTDEWATFTDAEGSFSSTDGRTDRFMVTLTLASLANIRAIQFCLRLEVDNHEPREFWDNNGGANYTIAVVTVEATANTMPLSAFLGNPTTKPITRMPACLAPEGDQRHFQYY